MYRYCTNCKKEFDFPIKSMTDLDNLLCPICHAKIDKSSRKPVDNTGTEKTEAAIGNGLAAIFRFFYIFYLICAITGILAFVLKQNALLYTMTGIALGSFLIQLFFRFTTFRTGLFFLPLGAITGFLIFKTLSGACLGIMVVFLLRQLIRDLFWKLIHKLINIGNR